VSDESLENDGRVVVLWRDPDPAKADDRRAVLTHLDGDGRVVLLALDDPETSGTQWCESVTHAVNWLNNPPGRVSVPVAVARDLLPAANFALAQAQE
jgi:hypothetical protein